MKENLFNDQLKDDPQFNEIRAVINSLWNAGVIQRGANFCLSMSDIIQKLLAEKGVKSKLVECKLIVMKNNPPQLTIVGQEDQFNLNTENQLDSHVVVVTETQIPMIIDTSIGYIDQNVPYVVAPLNGAGDYLGQYDINGSKWTYIRKTRESLPFLHQQSILERIKKDSTVDTSLKNLKFLITVAISISIINFILNNALIVLKLIWK